MAEITKLTADRERLHLDFQTGKGFRNRKTHSVTITPNETGFDIFVVTKNSIKTTTTPNTITVSIQ